MISIRSISVVAATAALLVGPVTGASAASTAPKAPVKGGVTTVRTAPGLATTLLKNNLFAYGVSPGRTGVAANTGIALTFSLPVTGGKASVSPLGGTVKHSGSIAFVNFALGKRIKVGNFTIDLTKGRLTGIVNGDPKARVPLFDLDLSKAKLKVTRHRVTASHVGLRLTATAAGALNTTLCTKVFTAGLLLGSATTQLKI
ncbi:MAG: hypothetical protein ABIS86_21510 [Streptosporangiaceae bacterium]